MKFTPSKNVAWANVRTPRWSCVDFKMIAASQRWATRLKPAIVRIRQQSTLNEGYSQQIRCLRNENPRTARTFGIRGHQNRGRDGCYSVTQKSFSSEPRRLKIDGGFFSMKLQILSDLHLESPKAYDVYEIKPSAPHLALLGDIGCVSDPGYLDFLTAQLAQFRTVFHLLGNHEPYDSGWDNSIKTLRAFQEQNRQDRAQQPSTGADGIGEYVLLDRDEFHLPGHNLTILGCTLFSDVPEASKNTISFGLNDFFRIGGWTVEHHIEAHRRDVAWLNERVAAISREDPERRIAVLTHHSPTVDARSVNPRHVTSKLRTGFATDLSGEECWRAGNVVFWAFGHTHYNFDHFRDGNTGKVVYSNQRGYYFAQAPGFDQEDVVDLSD